MNYSKTATATNSLKTVLKTLFHVLLGYTFKPYGTLQKSYTFFRLGVMQVEGWHRILFTRIRNPLALTRNKTSPPLPRFLCEQWRRFIQLCLGRSTGQFLPTCSRQRLSSTVIKQLILTFDGAFLPFYLLGKGGGDGFYPPYLYL